MRVEVEVRGAEHVRHSVEGRMVLEYDRLQIGGGNVSGFDPAIKTDGTSLGEGYTLPFRVKAIRQSFGKLSCSTFRDA